MKGITATTTADVASPAGVYPITLQACNNYNPNYDVTLQNGTLTVGGNIGGRTSGDIKMENKKGKASLVPKLNPNTGVSSNDKLYPNTGSSSVDKLYPNPAFSRVRLELKEDVQRTEDIQLYDKVGKLNRISVRRVNEKIYDIDVSALSQGVYVMKVKTSGGLKTFRFVKL
ncbi:MAG: T9SS type A sorting domain-containing protein [Chitinophagaceae bacterium]